VKTPAEKLIDFITADPLTAEEADFIILALLHLRYLQKGGQYPQFLRYFFAHDSMSEAVPVPRSAASIAAAERKAAVQEAFQEGKRIAALEARRQKPPDGPAAK